MLRKISHKIKLSMMPTAVGTCQRRPTFDVGLGFALMRDRRVEARARGKAMATGAGIAGSLLGLDIVLGHLLRVGTPAIDWPMHGLCLLAGWLIFGMLALVQLAPMDVVTRLRYERYRIIPLKRVQAVVRERAPLPSSFRAAPTPRYAVIPRRMR